MNNEYLTKTMQEVSNEIREHLIATCKGKQCEWLHTQIRSNASKYLSNKLGLEIYTTSRACLKFSIYLSYEGHDLFIIDIKRKKAQENRLYFEPQFNYNDFEVRPIRWGNTEEEKNALTLGEVVQKINELKAKEQSKKEADKQRIKAIYHDVMQAYNLTQYEARYLFKACGNFYGEL